ncbi:energy-coupling factor transporter transmembrane component T [Exiguobacterium antarcticum]|uniref:Energy-coupling factor transporter transmembrane component T n=1 Tax=Exiguobacterium antarcticum TaxID=132920 RepID=A0ABT6R5L3_9BACL|nr:energy-coupling factor transporter transmembrane component T [Exiguobacterium antarcticum]MDI3236222.1 energy-coupling factor transporter transmembrane component T [Exiguobacterium antarcticum]
MQENKSLLTRINPSVKLGTLLYVMFLLITTSSLRVTLALLLLALVGLVHSGWPLTTLIRRLAPYSLLFLLTFWMMAAFGKGSTELWTFGWFRITEESLDHAWLIAIRMLAFVFLSLTFVATTDPIRFVMSLIHQCRLPVRLAYGFLAGIRFIPIFRQAIRTIRQARRVRQQRSIWPWETFFDISLPLFTTSIIRSEQIAIAMEARQFQANRTYYVRPVVTRFDLLFFGLVSSIATSLRLFV